MWGFTLSIRCLYLALVSICPGLQWQKYELVLKEQMADSLQMCKYFWQYSQVSSCKPHLHDAVSLRHIPQKRWIGCFTTFSVCWTSDCTATSWSDPVSSLKRVLLILSLFMIWFVMESGLLISIPNRLCCLMSHDSCCKLASLESEESSRVTEYVLE